MILSKEELELLIKNNELVNLMQKITEPESFIEGINLAIDLEKNEVIKTLIIKNKSNEIVNPIEIFKIIIMKNNPELAKWMVENQYVDFNSSNSKQILTTCFTPRNMLKMFTRNENNQKVLKTFSWLCTFKSMCKELKSETALNYCTIFTSEKIPLIPILFSHINKDKDFKKIWNRVLKKCAIYDNYDLFNKIKGEFTVSKEIWNIIIVKNLESTEHKIIKKNLNDIPFAKSTIQSLINSPKDKIEWTQETIKWLESINIDLCQNKHLYLKIWEQHKKYMDNIVKECIVLDLLDILKEKLYTYPNILEQLLEHDIDKDHKKEFIAITNYYKLQEKLEIKEVIAKTRKI